MPRPSTSSLWPLLLRGESASSSVRAAVPRNSSSASTLALTNSSAAIRPFSVSTTAAGRPTSVLTSSRQAGQRYVRVGGKEMLGRRGFMASAIRSHGDIVRPAPGTGIKVIFRDHKGNDIKTVEGNEGDDLLSLAHEYDVDLEGACEKSLACSTCHVILDPEIYDNLPEPEDEENDMLDLAFGLEDTSRLGCQVFLKRDMDGMVAKIPSATRNMYVDGAKARTH